MKDRGDNRFGYRRFFYAPEDFFRNGVWFPGVHK